MAHRNHGKSTTASDEHKEDIPESPKPSTNSETTSYQHILRGNDQSAQQYRTTQGRHRPADIVTHQPYLPPNESTVSKRREHFKQISELIGQQPIHSFRNLMPSDQVPHDDFNDWDPSLVPYLSEMRRRIDDHDEIHDIFNYDAAEDVVDEPCSKPAEKELTMFEWVRGLFERLFWWWK